MGEVGRWVEMLDMLGIEGNVEEQKNFVECKDVGLNLLFTLASLFPLFVLFLIFSFLYPYSFFIHLLLVSILLPLLLFSYLPPPMDLKQLLMSMEIIVR